MDDRFRYPPSHPWYYRDNAPLPASGIPPGDASLYDDLPQTRKAQLTELAAARATLGKDIARYQELVERGADALSGLDRRYDNLNGSLALKHNHIHYHRGLILALEKLVGPEQGTLF